MPRRTPKPHAISRSRVREITAAPAATIAAGKFKARCLALMDEVKERHVEYVITKHGKPVAKLVPVDEEAPSALGAMKGTVLWYGDIISPVDVEWDAMQQDG